MLPISSLGLRRETHCVRKRGNCLMVVEISKYEKNRMENKRKSRLNSRQSKRVCMFSGKNSDNEFPTTSILVENGASRPKANKIKLEDPLKLMMRRKQEDEIRKTVYKLDGSPLKRSQGNTELQDLMNIFENEVHQPEIKPFPPGRHIFLSRHLFRMFSKGRIPDEDNLSVEQLLFIENILNTETRKKEILYYLRDTWNSEKLNSVCDYIFFLVSVHDNEILVNEGAMFLNEVTSWYPKVDNIFKILLNWGASVMSDMRCTAQRFQSSYPAPIFMENCKQILKIVSIKAEQIMKHITEEKECILLKSIIDGALDVHCIHTCPNEFRTCITALLNAIPDYHWNPRKVEMICRSLHTKDDVHNLYYVCAEILTARPRCEQLGWYLASLTVHKMLDLSFNDGSIMDFLMNSKPLIKKLSLYQLYLMNQLVFILTKREKETNKKMNLMTVTKWFGDLRRQIKKFTNQTSLDYATVHELIDRCVTYWRIEMINEGIYV